MERARIEKYLNTQESNLAFITKRLEIQTEPNYTPYKRLCVGFMKRGRTSEPQYISIRENQYNPIELEIIEDKIKLAKKYLENTKN